MQVVQLLLGHTKLESTVRYLGIEVDDAFHARFECTGRAYRYIIVNRRPGLALERDRAWLVRSPLDADAMNEAVQALAGTHDFQSFRAARCQAATSVRTIPHWEVLRVGDEVHLFATGHGFLQHMIRIVAGSLTEVGRGRRPVGWIGEVLHARDRSCAGRTAPASGLTLMSVTYGPDGR